MPAFKTWVKTYLLTGLIVVVPITITVYIIQVLIGVMDDIVSVLPADYHPDTLLGFHLPGLGVVLVTLLVFMVGLLTRNYAGKKLVSLGELLVSRIPFVSNIYRALKQFTEAIFSSRGNHFKQVVMLEFPRSGLYSLGFVAGRVKGELESKTNPDMMNVFIPCSPNPTTGYYVIVPEKDLIPLTMTVEEAFKVIISGGLVSPDSSSPSGPKAPIPFTGPR
jgi:uncharacterized membrane protein